MRFKTIGLSLGIGVMSTGLWAEAPVELKFSPQGKFKIVQFADSHLSDKESEKDGDNSDAAVTARATRKKEAMLKDMQMILDKEKPDLVYFSGDNVLTTRNPFDMWLQLVKPLNDRNIPWIAVMGNHDSEWTKKTNSELMAFLEQQRGSLSACGPKALGGGGNYVLTIKSSSSEKPVFSLFCMDSGGYADKRFCDGYAWFSADMISWFRQQTQLLADHNGGKPLPSLAFFHIPLPEFDYALKSGKIIGNKGENVCCAQVNSGMFSAMLESRSILGVFVGHDHNNDYVTSFHGIALGYGRKNGEFCYFGLPGGARVIELEENSRSFSTWICTAAPAEENRVRIPEDFPLPPTKK